MLACCEGGFVRCRCRVAVEEKVELEEWEAVVYIGGISKGNDTYMQIVIEL